MSRMYHMTPLQTHLVTLIHTFSRNKLKFGADLNGKQKLRK